MIQQEIQENTNYLKDFVPYKQALALKELGFDEPCFGYFNKTWSKENELLFPQYVGELENWNNTQHLCSAPTFSQAFRFFREEKLSDSCVCRYQSRDDGGIYYYYVINHDFGIKETKHFKEGFFSYEEAELECLKKLIEIVKQQP